MKKKIIGIDIGGTTIKIAFLSWDGTILVKWEIPTRKEEKGRYILEDIAKAIEEKMEHVALTKDDFHAVGVGVPGPVQLQVGYLPIAVNLGGFGDVNINDALGDLLGIPVITDNDANVAALGEMWLGSGEGEPNLVMFTLGTGVGGGIIVNSQIVSGFSGSGGEIGHIPIVEPDDDVYVKCNCGAYGCIETVSSANGVVRVAEYYLAHESTQKSILREETGKSLTSESIYRAAQLGDTIALKTVHYAAKYLAKAMNILSVTVNPSCFIIGGGVSKSGDFLLHLIQEYYGKNIFSSAVENVDVVIASLGNDAGVIGAAYHARSIHTYGKK